MPSERSDPGVVPAPATQTGADPAAPAAREPWRDRGLPVAERVADLLARMTPEEKAGQLAGFWAMPAEAGAPVAPMEDDSHEPAPPLEEVLDRGLGQLTRVFGTLPVAAADGAARLRELQGRVAAGNRFGIPAIAHEECLNGFMTWGATVFPSPPAWGATFDAELVAEIAAAIGASMRAAASTRASPPCWTSSATPAGGARRSASARTRTWSGSSAPPTWRRWNGRASSRPQALRRATPPPAPDGTWPRRRSGRASSPTSSWSRS